MPFPAERLAGRLYKAQPRYVCRRSAQPTRRTTGELRTVGRSPRLLLFEAGVLRGLAGRLVQLTSASAWVQTRQRRAFQVALSPFRRCRQRQASGGRIQTIAIAAGRYRPGRQGGAIPRRGLHRKRQALPGHLRCAGVLATQSGDPRYFSCTDRKSNDVGFISTTTQTSNYPQAGIRLTSD